MLFSSLKFIVFMVTLNHCNPEKSIGTSTEQRKEKNHWPVIHQTKAPKNLKVNQYISNY